MPDAVASACLVEYLGSRWVLTVSHAVGDGGNWAVECGFEPGLGTKLYQLGQMNFAAIGELCRSNVRELDLAYVTVPADLVPRWQPSDSAGTRIADLPREPVSFHFEPPSKHGSYGFAGNVKPSRESHRGNLFFAVEQVAYSGLQYIGDEAEFHLFKLPFRRPDHEWLQGTSGSPILDGAGNAVALVCGAGDDPQTIRGIAMRYFRSLLQVTARGTGIDSGRTGSSDRRGGRSPSA